MIEGIVPHGRYSVVARDLHGRIVWAEEFDNLVTTAGKNLLGNVMFGATAKSASWFVGLKGVGTASTADTAASHAGWSEVTGYSQSVRQTLTLAAFSGGSGSNSAAQAVFTINASVTVNGVFVVDSNTKGGTAGTLYSVGSFSSDISLSSGTITVTYTASF